MTRARRFKGNARNISNRSFVFRQGYLCAMRDVITETHIEATTMNDPRARAVLNCFARHLGHMKHRSKGGKI